MADPYAATADDRFSFGLWTVGHRGGDPFGVATRPPIGPEEIVARLGEVGAWGVSLHDEDLVPFGSSAAERDRIVASFAAAVERAGMVVSMTTVNLFTQPIFRDGEIGYHFEDDLLVTTDGVENLTGRLGRDILVVG